MAKLKKYIDHTSQERFDRASRLLETHKHHRMLDWQMWRWCEADYRYLPIAWLDLTLREVLQTQFAQIVSTPGIGQRKLEKLLAAVDDARHAIEQSTSARSGDPAIAEDFFPYRIAADAYFLGPDKAPIWELDDRAWESVAQLIRHHCLEDYVLGRFAPSLRRLHRPQWQERISTLTRRRFSEIVRLKGYGDIRIRHAATTILSIAFTLHALPASQDARLSLLSGRIAQAHHWLAQLQRRLDCLPDAQSIRNELLRPLLTQLNEDTNTRLSQVAERRIGAGNESPTLQAIACEFHVTNDRIRTLLQQVAVVFHVRWQEGNYLLQGVCAELSAYSAATEQRHLLERIHQVFFGARKVRSDSA